MYWTLLSSAPQIIALIGMIGPLFQKNASISPGQVDAMVSAVMSLLGRFIPEYKNLSNIEIESIAHSLNKLAWQVKQDIEDGG